MSSYYQEFNTNKINEISKSKDFREWYDKRKDWVEIVIHGVDHKKPPEFLRSKEEQEEIIKKCIKDLKPYLNMGCLGFKSPFYRMNNNTLEILKRLGFKWVNEWWHIVPLEVIKKPLEFMLLPSHTGNLPLQKNPDDIELAYDELNKILFDAESKGFTYATIGEAIKEVL